MDKLLLALLPALDQHLFKRRWIIAAMAMTIIIASGSSGATCQAIAENDICDYEIASYELSDSQFASEDLTLTAE